jgi:hypothetical protein
MGRFSKRSRSALVTTSLVGTMALSLVALLLVSDQRDRWLTIGSENGQGNGYGYEPSAVNVTADVTVKGATPANGNRKLITVAVTNLSMDSVAVDPAQHIDVTVTVNGNETGDIRTLGHPAMISPGDTKRFRFQWVHSGTLSRGDTVEYSACVDVPGDVDDGDDCDSVIVTAR